MAASPAVARFPHHPVDAGGRSRPSARRRCILLRPPAQPVGRDRLAVHAANRRQGGTFTQADLKGTPSLVFFGYTFCPDVCPTTMAELVATDKQELGLSAEQLRTIFVTVDPGARHASRC